MRVQLHRNLNKKGPGGGRVWTLRTLRSKKHCSRTLGKVDEHVSGAILENVCFIVSEPGRQKMIRRGRRDVFAWIEGDLVEAFDELPAETPPEELHGGRLTYLTFNPYEHDFFVRVDTGEYAEEGTSLAVVSPMGVMVATRGLRGFGVWAAPLFHPEIWNG